MFAGPNGSGKSSLKEVLPEKLQGVYLNPDELEKTLKSNGSLDLSDFRLEGASEKILERLRGVKRPGSSGFDRKISNDDAQDRLVVDRKEADSYFASALVECMREELLERRISFTFETVMSHPSKVDVLIQTKRRGYRSYLYYVATKDKEINISRVENRVKLGGHPVPIDKIRDRYDRSLDLLFEAIRASDRADIFDNSGEGTEQSWIAEVTDGKEIEFKTSLIPHCFKVQVLDKIRP